MSQSNPTASEIARLQDASEWVQRLSESNDPALLDQWTHWCGADAMNLPAFEQMQRLWNAFPQARATTSHPTSTSRSKERHWLMALAACVVLLVGAAGWFALRFSDELLLETAIGEQRRVTLVDGSGLDLAPGSLVSTRFTLMRREVRLIRGQAFFSVSHSPVRPFVVDANSLRVTAVGTEFDVRITPSSTAVTVSEGRVTVAPDGDGISSGSNSTTEIIRAGVGQRVTFSQTAHRMSVVTVSPKLAGSWRNGNLLFVGEPLEDVIDAVNRYSEPPIVVAPAFQRTRFTGTVSPTRIHDWLKALEQIYPVEVVDQGKNGVLIRSRANGT